MVKHHYLLASALLLAGSAWSADFDLPTLPPKAAVQPEVKEAEDITEAIDFTPIEASSVGEISSVKDTLSIQEKPIPENLNKALRVGVFVGVKTLFVIDGKEEVKITANGNSLKIQGKGKPVTVNTKDYKSAEQCLSIAQESAKLKTFCYPGKFTITAQNGTLKAVNTVDVEEYLRGVVPYEIGKLDTARFEALKAQAVAARTYAYKHFGSRESVGFDVYADTKDQVYMGLNSATSLTDAAVKATQGEVLTYNNDFIIAYYHSTCGGMTETLATWGRENLPYLKSKEDLQPSGKPWCEESSYSSWERKFKHSELSEMFKKNAKEAQAKAGEFSQVKNVSVKDTFESGRIQTLLVETDKGSFQVQGDKVRWLFKKAGAILPASFFSLRREGEEWILSGKGFGHGVGMCQMGVRRRAAAGQSYQEILGHYYDGVTLTRFIR